MKKGKIFIRILLFVVMLNAIHTFVFASPNSTIGTAEVTAATNNIRNVITSIAMPLRRCFNICKCCDSLTQNDSKRK